MYECEGAGFCSVFRENSMPSSYWVNVSRSSQSPPLIALSRCQMLTKAYKVIQDIVTHMTLTGLAAVQSRYQEMARRAIDWVVYVRALAVA